MVVVVQGGVEDDDDYEDGEEEAGTQQVESRRRFDHLLGRKRVKVRGTWIDSLVARIKNGESN